MNSEKSKSPLRDKSYAFAIKIVKLSQNLVSERKEFVLSKQIIRSGTTIGAILENPNLQQVKQTFHFSL